MALTNLIGRTYSFRFIGLNIVMFKKSVIKKQLPRNVWVTAFISFGYLAAIWTITYSTTPNFSVLGYSYWSRRERETSREVSGIQFSKGQSLPTTRFGENSSKPTARTLHHVTCCWHLILQPLILFFYTLKVKW